LVHLIHHSLVVETRELRAEIPGISLTKRPVFPRVVFHHHRSQDSHFYPLDMSSAFDDFAIKARGRFLLCCNDIVPLSSSPGRN
jgi:hypothetical protein